MSPFLSSILFDFLTYVLPFFISPFLPVAVTPFLHSAFFYVGEERHKEQRKSAIRMEEGREDLYRKKKDREQGGWAEVRMDHEGFLIRE